MSKQSAGAGRHLWFAAVIVLLLAGSLLFFRRQHPAAPEKADRFLRQMQAGKNYLDKGEAGKAVAAFQEAVAVRPSDPDAQLDLANAYLLADQSTQAVAHALEAVKLDPKSAAGYYVAGCAYLRLRQHQAALQYLQQAHDIDVAEPVAAVSFQKGRAHLELGQLEDAIHCFEETVQLDPNHPAAYYLLSQALVRAGKRDEGAEALQKHQAIAATRSAAPSPTAATYEQCRYTQARIPFQLEQPDPRGVTVTFHDATQSALGKNAGNYQGPVGVLDLGHRGQNDLVVREGATGFRILANTNGVFSPLGELLPALPDCRFYRCLVGDLQNDRAEDLIFLGDKGSQVFKLSTNGAVADMSRFSGLADVAASDGALVDFDFTGKLDLIASAPDGSRLRLFRNLGNFSFQEITQTSGIPANLSGVRQIAADDWNNDDLMDVFLARSNQPPLLLLKQRGGGLIATNLPPVEGSAVAVGDLNNDLQNDLLTAAGDHLQCDWGGPARPRLLIPLGTFPVQALKLIDYDNDGWLDIFALGKGLRVWRNRGEKGFQEVTHELGLDPLAGIDIESVVAADFNNDCATDLLIAQAQGGLKLFLNQGAQQNKQLKLFLIGNRSNASGLGIRLELRAGGWRAIRTVTSLPVEIGVGRASQIDSLTARWFDLAVNSADVPVECQRPLALMELILPTGSCPYLYTWDGGRFRFLTDLLGASPLGLRLADDHFIDADPAELVWLGDEKAFPPRNGSYALQISEELREVLYLDEAKLVAVDHPVGTVVASTSKLRPGKPFPSPGFTTLAQPLPLLRASREEGEDVTARLKQADGLYVSPPRLRVPQLRGLAERFSVILDFGPLNPRERLVLVLNGWLRFGGGMANVAASHHPDLPFPFPQLEAETADHRWQPVDVIVGAPAGKTKTIIADLTGKLPFPTGRLRLSTAFEIHWDKIELWHAASNDLAVATFLKPSHTDLHWRGFSAYAPLPEFVPLTPDYQQVRFTPNWRLAVSGWCTRYGAVDDLLQNRDDALVLMNAGDELTLNFDAALLRPVLAGYQRDFFLYSVGWDKDADFHVERGTTVEPLPFQGMNDQLYGHENRPARANDGWMTRYNTRWVGPLSLTRREPGH